MMRLRQRKGNRSLGTRALQLADDIDVLTRANALKISAKEFLNDIIKEELEEITEEEAQKYLDKEGSNS